MYKIKNLSTKKFEQGLLEEFLDFANKSLEIDKPYSVYFVDDKDNASDALGKTAMYNPSTNSVYVYVTDRHPKDVLRSVAHELMHHKQNCDGRLDRTYGEGSDDLEMLEREANEAGYLVRQFEDGRKNTSEEMELDEAAMPFIPGLLVILGSFLLDGDTDFENLQNKQIKKLDDLYKEGKISKKEAIRAAIKIRNLTERPETVRTLETWTEFLDVIGAYPGVGEPFDLISALIKIYLIVTKYSNPPHNEDKFEIPFFDFWMYTRNYFIIDAVASILGATTIGEPIKLAIKGLAKATQNIKWFMLSNRALQRIYAILLQPDNTLTALLNKITGGRWKKDLEDAQASLKASLKRADALVDSVKARGKIDRVVSEVDNLDEVEAFQFITGATQIGKGPLGGRTFSLLDKTGEVDGIFRDAFENTLAKKARQLATATEEFASLRINSFNKYVEDLVKNMDPAEAAKVQALFDGLEDADKALIGYIIDEAFKYTDLSSAMAATSWKNIFRMSVIDPLVDAAKSGKKVTKADLQKYLNELPPGTTDIYEVLGQIPEVIDFSKAVRAAEDIVTRRARDFYSKTFYKRVLREEIGKIVQQRLKKVKEGVDKTFEELDDFVNGRKSFDDLSPGAKEAVKNPDTWVTTRYVEAQNEIMGEMASSGSNLMNQAEQAAFKRAQTGEGPIKRAMSVPKRAATKAKSLRAAIRGTVGRGTASVKVTNFFLATLSRNLLGRGAISGMVFQDRMVNFVPKLMGEILGSAAKAGPVSKVVHALYATTLTAWLRVMSLDELDLGGGEEGGAASAAQMALSAMKRAEEKKRQKAANAQLQKIAKVTNKPMVVTVINAPVTLPSAATATKASQELDPLKDEKNPELAKQVTETQKAIDEYAKKVKNKPKPEDRKEAAVELSEKLTKTADDGLEKAKEETATTVQESPKVEDVPVGAKQEGLEKADKTDERTKGTKEGIDKILKGGAGQKGEGPGAGGLAGTGGTATGRKGASKLSLRAISQYIDQVDPYAHPLLTAPDKVQPRNTIYYKNFKSVPPQALRRAYKGLIDAYNKATEGTGTADTVVDVDNLKRVFPSATFQDLPVENGKITNFRSFANWLNNTREVIANYKGRIVMENKKKCFASYRERVFNERFEKLTKGFTK